MTWLSTYCSCSILVTVALIIWEACNIFKAGAPSPENVVVASTDSVSLLLGLPILGCAMFGHMNISQIYAELRPDVKPNASKMVAVACIGTIALYASVGAAGYAAFGSSAMSDVVAQMAKQQGQTGSVSLMQALLASFIVLKTPLLIMPMRSISLSIFRDCVALRSKARDVEQSSPVPQTFFHHAILTFMLLACVYIVALAFPDLGTLLQILGAVVVVPLCFIVPARLAWSAETPRPSVLCVCLGFTGLAISVLSVLVVAFPQIKHSQ